MNRITAWLAAVCLGLCGWNASAAVDPAQFTAWFEASCRGDLKVPQAVARRAAGFRYVFVAGLKNESMPGYFAQNMKALRALGVPRSAIHEVDTSSRKPMTETCPTLRTELHAIAERGPERLVIIAHSRGACEVFACALEDADFVREHVEALFLVQGPFGGSGLADMVTGHGERIDHQMPRPARTLARVALPVERLMFRKLNHRALPELTRESAREFWQDRLADHAEALPALSPRTFFVATQVDPARKPRLRDLTANYLETYYGPNDGMVAVFDQSLPGIGTRLGPLACGHTDLTHKFPRSRAPREFRTALVESIVMLAGQPDHNGD